MHSMYKNALAEYAKNVAAPRIKERAGRKFIEEFALHWERYSILVYWLLKPFQFLVVFPLK